MVWIIRILSKIDTQTKKRGKSSLSAEGAKVCSKKRKRSTILPIFMVQSFFCVLFFSFCSNLSIWPVRQVVPIESRCYTPIFDGLVWTIMIIMASLADSSWLTSLWPPWSIIMIIIEINIMIRSGATVPTSQSPTREQNILHRKMYFKINIFAILKDDAITDGGAGSTPI